MTYTPPSDYVLVVPDVIQPLACETDSLDKLKELTASYNVQAFSNELIVVKGKSYSSILYENLTIQIQNENSEVNPVFSLKNYTGERIYILCDDPRNLFEVQINLLKHLVYNTAMLCNIIIDQTQNEIGDVFYINADLIIKSTLEELLLIYRFKSGADFITSLVNSVLMKFNMSLRKNEDDCLYVQLNEQNYDCKERISKLMIPHNQSAFEFFIGENEFIYDSIELITDHHLKEFKLNLLTQLITTLKLTYVNYSNTGMSLNNEHVNKIEKLKRSIS